jgi:carboxypeptidase Taq
MEVETLIRAYNDYIKRINAYKYALNVINFDAATGAPKSAIKERSEAYSFIALEYFKLKTSPEFKSIIANLKNVYSKLDKYYQRIVDLEIKTLDKISKIPPHRYQEFSKLSAESEVAWEEAKEKSDYQIFKPYLEKIVSMVKEFAHYYGGEIDGSLYNRMLDDYEEGMTIKKLDEFFNTLKERIVPLLEKIKASKIKIDDSFIYKNYPHEGQILIGEEILKVIGFDLENGMLRESAHPFTSSISNSDIRVTTHIYENNVISSIYSVIHEGGHGIYDQNINPKFKGTILYDGASMAIHESQSRLYENVIGRSKEFVHILYELLKKIYPLQMKKITEEDLYLAVNKVEPSFIRTEADELTYSLHILVRYEMEKLIIDGNVSFDELPSIWNQKMKEYLGIEPKNDKEGILQDIHWAGGSFGYFPSYALGNAIGLQLLHTMKKELDFKQAIVNKNFDQIKEYLAKNVYIHGKMLSPMELLKEVTGEELNASYYCDYLEQKFKEIYLI